jgi:hypothetical protein
MYQRTSKILYTASGYAAGVESRKSIEFPTAGALGARQPFNARDRDPWSSKSERGGAIPAENILLLTDEKRCPSGSRLRHRFGYGFVSQVFPAVLGNDVAAGSVDKSADRRRVVNLAGDVRSQQPR